MNGRQRAAMGNKWGERPVIPRFWSRVVKRDDGCWEWSGSKLPRGYGVLSVNGKRTYAHRFSWSMHNGGADIPVGAIVMHTCDFPSCVNPGHLRVGTQYENMLDMTIKGRRAVGARVANKNPRRGEQHCIAKLKEYDVIDIRRSFNNGEPVGSISIRYAMSPGNIRRIARRATWQHVAGE